MLYHATMVATATTPMAARIVRRTTGSLSSIALSHLSNVG